MFCINNSIALSSSLPAAHAAVPRPHARHAQSVPSAFCAYRAIPRSCTQLNLRSPAPTISANLRMANFENALFQAALEFELLKLERTRPQQVRLDAPDNSSCDSGYCSQDISPIKSCTPQHSPLSRPPLKLFFDGSSEDGSNRSAHSQPSPASSIRSTSLPRLPRSQLDLPDTFKPDATSRPRRVSDAAAIGLPRSAVQTPNRYIPFRETVHPAHQRHRTSKDVSELTPGERLTRSNKDSPDPFCFHRRGAPPSPPKRRHAQVPIRNGSIFDTATRHPGSSERRVSNGIWSVGGSIPTHGAVDNGHGRRVRSGTHAQVHNSSFPPRKRHEDLNLEKHEARLASALDVDYTSRILDFSHYSTVCRKSSHERIDEKINKHKTKWDGVQWISSAPFVDPETPNKMRILPAQAWKILEAPAMRNDYYCSVLAWSEEMKTLAVGAGNSLYAWSEETEGIILEKGDDSSTFLTSLDYSSTAGGNCILAYGRADGSLSFMSQLDVPQLVKKPTPRFVLQPHPEGASVACVSWRPVMTQFWSADYPREPAFTEDLLVGDDRGHVYYYAVQWAKPWEVEQTQWPGRVACLLRISVHHQQICGLAWSPNGVHFATGGNDNLCALFETDHVVDVSVRVKRYAWNSSYAYTAGWNELEDTRKATLNVATMDQTQTRRGRIISSEDLPPRTIQPQLLPMPGTDEEVASWNHAIDYMRAYGLTAEMIDISQFPDSIVPRTDISRDQYADMTRQGLDSPRDTTSIVTGLLERAEGLRRSVAAIAASVRSLTPLPDPVTNDVTDYGQQIPTQSLLEPADSQPLQANKHHAKFRWRLNAAVKAIAFCPWRDGLVAVGGGSYDKCIHFFHTTSGIALATIAVHAQVTSLVWSTTRREIAATFGYAQPQHPIRIAVFSWPECRPIAAVPWEGEHRALYAIALPSGSLTGGKSDGTLNSQQHGVERDGCLVVASSEGSVKFHEVWSAGRGATVGGVGLLGGSKLLEDMDGVDQDIDLIR